MNECILIVYTTQYRKGGRQFKLVAETLAGEKSKVFSKVICRATESKLELKKIFEELKRDGIFIREFHFIGHAGMYGPMFGTIQYPEQFSPHEIKALDVPFSKEAKAFFHCCRSARWFAPFFAKEKKVTTYGYYWYTSFSAKKDRYMVVWGGKLNNPLYCFGCPGRKSHGYLASFKKLTGTMKAESLKEFLYQEGEVDASYNKVASIYDRTFQNIRVREDEFSFLTSHLPVTSSVKVLDIGCGNGALLRQLANQIEEGVGVDTSSEFVKLAVSSSRAISNLRFKLVDGPSLPFEDNYFDVVISMMSFRYLDWDPIMVEIERVLKESGKLLIVDMVTAPVRWHEWPAFFRDKVGHYLSRLKYRDFYMNLKHLVSHPSWAEMLKYNPIRSEHEMKWYLESRFPGRKVKVINVGYNSRILAFDSGDMKEIHNINLSYP